MGVGGTAGGLRACRQGSVGRRALSAEVDDLWLPGRCLVIVGVEQSMEPPEATADTSPSAPGMPQAQDLRTRRARPRGPRPAGTARRGPTRPSSRCRSSPPAPQESTTLRFGHIHRCRDRERRGTPQAAGRAAVSIHLSFACSSFLTRFGSRSQRNTRQARRPCLLSPARARRLRRRACPLTCSSVVRTSVGGPPCVQLRVRMRKRPQDRCSARGGENRAASTLTRVSGIPAAFHSHTNVTGPGGGSGQSQ